MSVETDERITMILGDNSFWFIANTTTDNKIGHEGVASIGEVLKKNEALTALNLNRNKKNEAPWYQQEICIPFPKNQKTTDNLVEIEGTKLLSESLKTNTTLVFLNLGGESVLNNVPFTWFQVAFFPSS